MASTKQDVWSDWLLKRRFGGDEKHLKSVMDFLLPIRDKVLFHADIQNDDVLLDVGCGDGLVSFGALQANTTCNVVFADISLELLQEAQKIAEQQNLSHRCQFVCNAAENLNDILSESVNVVTTRSVLIYVSPKQEAFNEFYRVLKPEGRLSVFEPINRFSSPEPDNILWGFDITPIAEIAQKVKAIYRKAQPLDNNPMLDFDERDLVIFAEKAGFKEVNLELQVAVKPKQPASERGWETLLETAWNPKVPTVSEVLNFALSPAERESFISFMRPLYEEQTIMTRSAVAYLWATK